MHSSRFFMTLSALILTVLPAVADPMSAQDVFSKAQASVVMLKVSAKDGNDYVGSGFIAFKDGLAVTAWHVVHDAKAVTATFADGQEFDVSGLVDKDPKRDIALVKVKEFGRTPLTLATDTPPVGSKAFAIGAPESLSFTISDGLVSQVRQESGVNVYQFSSPTSPGNSGGPVLNDQGQVIGVVSFQFTEGQNLNFAIPSTYVLALDPTLPTTPWDKVADTTAADDNSAQPAAVSPVSSDDGTPPATPASIAGKPIEDVNQFFDDFMFDKDPPKKSPFETNDEYAKRIAHKLKPGQTYYFAVDRGRNPSKYDQVFYKASTDRNASDYVLDTGQLTLYAGAFQSDDMDENLVHGTVPLALDRIVKNTGQYDATDSYGHHATVTQFEKSAHIFLIRNHRDFRGKVEFRDQRMGITTTIKDRDRARTIDEKGEVVLGVHFDRYDDGEVKTATFDPSFDEPYDQHAKYYRLSVTLDTVLVVDPATDTVVVEYADKQ